MGQKVDSYTFDLTEYKKRLNDEQAAFAQVKKEMQADGDVLPKVGLEIEFFLLDEQQAISQSNTEFVQAAGPDFVCEIAQSSAEFNSKIFTQSSSMFSDLKIDLDVAWEHANRVASDLDKQLALIGTIPTASLEQYDAKYLTPEKRYEEIQPFLQIPWKNGMMEVEVQNKRLDIPANCFPILGAMSSGHVHLRVKSELNPAVYRAAQLLAPLSLATGTNAPYFLQQNICAESRVAIFDTLLNNAGQPRVFFPTANIQDPSFHEYFASLMEYEPWLYFLADEPKEKLWHLRLLSGTIYPWIRPTIGFDMDGGRPHVRLEFRFLSAGPTITDMLVNTACFIGAIYGLACDAQHPAWQSLSVGQLTHNFKQAAIHGLDANIYWADDERESITNIALDTFLPLAKTGLQALGADEKDIKQYLGVLGKRIENRHTGSLWQTQFMQKNHCSLQDMFSTYLENQRSARPVCDWSL